MSQSILTVPHDTLRKKSLPIDRLTPDIQAKVQDLLDSMIAAHDPEGVGLSFPQIGVNLRGFVTYLEKRMKVYLNPIILDMSEEKTLGGIPDRPTLEGCLSIPWLYGPVWRSKKIKIEAIDEHGTHFTKTLTSFPARLFLHEFDHLEGILFTDYTLRDQLPLYLLDRENDKFVQIADPSAVIKW
ncbi:MAG: Peptide deformylase [Candidatus Amesbacteria bacterium GW2011_GWA2_47_11]|uniref:Peptide deformylase n=1 Tax=Candidatus Amesbacteria bacterium GW2011_GWA2_47_11 TaxID=1618357 RepID=A0A0G1RH88_9BACT|nr:MAG: Peptide deformylase [Microgenomates group bacterium GW2011_GWC2_46_7]KKU56437.1 MAG: Peptide deformylase [Candidatus Amesbacteria bacterium GW2011_GWA2_47_11]